MPVELYVLLDRSAHEHRRSKTQEAIVALTKGLSPSLRPIRRPKRMKFKEKPTGKFIQDAINEGRP